MLPVVLVVLGVAGLSPDCGAIVTPTDMAAAGGQVEPERLNPAKLSPYPKILDINNDILIPQYTDMWMGQLHVALGSRYLLEVIGDALTPSERKCGSMC